MNNKFIKALKLGAVMLFAASSVSAARYDRKDRDASQENQMNQGHTMQESQMMGGYSAPARYDVRSAWDFFFSGDFIYWQNRVDGLAFGITTNPNPAGSLLVAIPPQNGRILSPEFSWAPGVRLALGMNFDLDSWSTQAEWTHLVSSSNTSVGIKDADINRKAIFPTRVFSEDDAVSADNVDHSFKNVLNILDFNMGRPFYSGKDLIMKPHVGFRASWMKNRENRTYGNLKDSARDVIGYLFYTTSSSSWGLGPRFGLDTDFLLGMGFRFFGNLAGSVQYVKHTFSTSGQNLNSASPIVAGQGLIGSVSNKKDSNLKPNVDTAIGFGWGTYFDNSNWHVDLSLAYEFNLWADRYLDYVFVDNFSIGSQVTTYQDVAYHGGTFKLRFDF